MRILSSLTAAAVLLGAMPFAAAVPSAYACSCMMPGSPAEEFEEADAVFAGKVTRVIDDEEAYSKSVQFAVSRQWKGDELGEDQLLELETAMDSAACGVGFQKGDEYLVYAFEDEETGGLRTYLCSRTTQLESADEDLAFLQTLEGGEAPEPEYRDVRDSTRYADAIRRLSVAGVFQGYPDGTFRPQATVNRAEFVKILMASRHAPEDIEICQQVADFAWYLTDVGGREWFASFVCQARLDGLVEGYPDRTFRPANEINVAEAAKIVAGAFGVDIQPQPGKDWYRPAVDALIAKNALPPTITGPDHKITRGEMAEMVYRLRYNVTDRETASF